MNETLQSELDLEVVDLGDAKELTMGILDPLQHEDSPQSPGRFVYANAGRVAGHDASRPTRPSQTPTCRPDRSAPNDRCQQPSTPRPQNVNVRRH